MPIPHFRDPQFRVRKIGERVVSKLRSGRTHQKLWRRLASRWLPILLGLMAVFGIMVIAAFAWFSRDLPNPDKVIDRSVAQSTKIYARDGKTLLYGNDTGWYPDETWKYLERAKPRFGFCSLDCTTILQESRKGHMGIAACEDVRTEFYKLGVADKDTKFCLHHFSHNGRLIYDELKELADTKGFLVSYDGAVFEV